MGLLTVTGAVAPAALAAEDTTSATPTALASSAEESAPVAPVLTPSPTPATSTPVASTPATDTPAMSTPAASTPAASPPAPSTPAAPATPVAAAVTPLGAHYGTGKLSVGLTTSDSVPAGQPALDPTGAQLELAFSVVEGAPSTKKGTCTFDIGSCTFPLGTDLPGETVDLGMIGGSTVLFPELPANSQFTLTLVTPPASGQLLFNPAAKPVQRGYTTTALDPAEYLASSLRLSVPTSHRPVGVTLGGSVVLAGATFELCTVLGGDCAGSDDVIVTATTDATGTADFDGKYVPGNYSVVQTTAPGGQAIALTTHTLTVPAARTVVERDTRFRLALGEPVGPPVIVPVDTPSTPAPAAPPPVNEVAEQSLAAGRQQTVSIGGFQALETVHGVLHSTPVDLGTVQADANGVATLTFTVPAALETGTHSVTMEGLTSGVVGTATFTVTAAAESAGGLAYTGADVLPLIALGGGLLAVGAGALTVANRRRSA